MAEKAGKVGAFYATSGIGKTVVAESHSLAAGTTWLSNKNVIVSNVYVGSVGTTKYTRWYCTPRGYLTVVDRVSATDSVNVTYKWWAEIGRPGTASGTIKQYGGFFNWSIDDTADVVDKTDFDDSGHKAFLANLDGWTGTAEKHWIGEGMFTKMGDHIIAKFYVEDDSTLKGASSGSDTGSRYEGYCYLVGLSPTVAVDTLVNESLSFQGTGQLSFEEYT